MDEGQMEDIIGYLQPMKARTLSMKESQQRPVQYFSTQRREIPVLKVSLQITEDKEREYPTEQNPWLI